MSASKRIAEGSADPKVYLDLLKGLFDRIVKGDVTGNTVGELAHVASAASLAMDRGGFTAPQVQRLIEIVEGAQKALGELLVVRDGKVYAKKKKRRRSDA